MSSTQSTDGGRTIDWPRGHERTDPSERDSYPGDLSPTRKESFESIVDELEAWQLAADRLVDHDLVPQTETRISYHSTDGPTSKSQIKTEQ
ncbi:hypothetical protein [Natrinema pallidum]|uniref:Uncharacterized protein n=1 Tax=Natrinema pallidum TaxID=69527 RepID=A0A4P9TFT4_9EURY|nr:hypothetical protein [Natrinema pallidum]QCW03579.1 hypothetical protein FGF80_10145 [Natrinema pallidum]